MGKNKLKYGELEYQLEGLKEAIRKIDKAIEQDKPNRVAIERNYFSEKAKRVEDEMTILYGKEKGE